MLLTNIYPIPLYMLTLHESGFSDFSPSGLTMAVARIRLTLL